MELGLRERVLKHPRCVCDRIRKRQNIGRWVKRLSGRLRVRLRPRTPNSSLFPFGSHRTESGALEAVSHFPLPY